jgi:hypothetical protein
MQYLLQTPVIEGKLKDASWDYWNIKHEIMCSGHHTETPITLFLWT